MKRKIFFFMAAIMLHPWPEMVSAKEIAVKSSIREVTVFLQGAQVIRESGVMIPAGASQVVFSPLPAGINPQTIQLQGKGSFTILSVKHRTNYLKHPEKDPGYVALNQKLDGLKLKKEKNIALLKILKDEESMLKANQSIRGDQSTLQVSEWKAALDFYTARLSEIADKRITLKSQQKKLDEEIKKITKQLQTYKANAKKPVMEIVADISSVKEQQAFFTLEYYVPQASWHPEYDIRVTDIAKPMNMQYRGVIKQNTGEKWENVKLILSTGNPSLGGTKPTLYPWYLDFYYPSPVSKGLQGKIAGVNISRKSVLARDVYEAPEAIPEASTPVVQQSESQTSVQFTIEAPFTIASDNQEQRVLVATYTLPVDYRYYVVPKLDRDAFLVALVHDWGKYNLLSGKMHMFFQGTYVGDAFLNVRNTSDTLELSLGRDRSISIERKKRLDFTQKQMLGSSIKETHGWEISIRNGKKTGINILVEEQIPVSKRKEIEVETLESSGAKINPADGKCTWNLHLNPGQTQKLNLSFSVKYPKNQHIIID
ncbi:MAG: mucoidy inhibitor MuiA family protein [Chlorobi bacterium]|nr:mucoidy inhibitor MuiA family protein [Chlorobiota bacterium]